MICSRKRKDIQIAHLNGRVPVWTCLCLFKFPAYANDFPQVPHKYRLSPEWALRCLFREPKDKNDFPHIEQTCSCFSVWALMCFSQQAAKKNDCSQTVQPYEDSCWSVNNFAAKTYGILHAEQLCDCFLRLCRFVLCLLRCSFKESNFEIIFRKLHNCVVLSWCEFGSAFSMLKNRQTIYSKLCNGMVADQCEWSCDFLTTTHHNMT